MTAHTWHGIGVGTLIVAIGLWFSILALSTSAATAFAIAAVAIVMASYAMAVFSRAEDPANTGFQAAIFALIGGAGMFGLFIATGDDPFMVASPIVAVGVSGIYALAPSGPLLRKAVRVTLLMIGSVVVWLVFTVDPTVYGLIVPLIPLPAIGFADRIFDRAVSVMAEEPLGGSDDAEA